MEIMHMIFRVVEGQWEGGRWVEGSGGLAFDGMRGKTHYRLTNFQVWAFTSLFALYCWVPTERSGDDPDLQLAETEQINHAKLSHGDQDGETVFQDACAYQMRLPRGSFCAASAFQRGFIYPIS